MKPIIIATIDHTRSMSTAPLHSKKQYLHTPPIFKHFLKSHVKKKMKNSTSTFTITCQRACWKQRKRESIEPQWPVPTDPVHKPYTCNHYRWSFVHNKSHMGHWSWVKVLAPSSCSGDRRLRTNLIQWIRVSSVSCFRSNLSLYSLLIFPPFL